MVLTFWVAHLTKSLKTSDEIIFNLWKKDHEKMDFITANTDNITDLNIQMGQLKKKIRQI